MQRSIRIVEAGKCESYKLNPFEIHSNLAYKETSKFSIRMYLDVITNLWTKSHIFLKTLSILNKLYKISALINFTEF